MVLALAAFIGAGYFTPGYGVDEPERALARLVSRTLDFRGAVDALPRWERAMYDMATMSAGDDLTQALRWYEELAAESVDPEVDLHLTILEAAAGRIENVRRRVREWTERGPPLAELAPLVGTAFLERWDRDDEEEEEEEEDKSDSAAADALVMWAEEAVAPGWFRDRLVAALAERAGDEARAAAAVAAIEARGRILLTRVRWATAAEAVLIVVGLCALVVVSRRPAVWRLGPARVPAPWPGWRGVAVLVRGTALAVVTAIALVFVLTGALMGFGTVAPGLYDRLGIPELAIDPLLTLLSPLPLLLIARRHLFGPAGVGLADGLGLRLSPGGGRGVLLVTLALVGAASAGDWLAGVALGRLGWFSHWSEGFDADLVFGSATAVALSLVSAIALAPLVEEVVFRGLLFPTLRRRLGLGTAAVASAALFSLAHLYGALGVVSVFWSGVLWAWAYERTGSLWPPLLAHAVNNLIASALVLLLLR